MGDHEHKEVSFFPFHAINEFMNDEYRLEVIRLVLGSLSEVQEEYRSQIERGIKHAVKIPGFRNSVKAPTPLKVKPTVDAFQKSPALAAAILAGWTGLHPDLRQQVYDLLLARNWELLPLDTDRTRLPGFLTKWPKDEDYTVLFQAFEAMYPDVQVEQNDVALMVVWLSNRLPYQFEDSEESASEETQEGQPSAE